MHVHRKPAVAALVMALAAVQGLGAAPVGAAPRVESADDLLIVDCLLPSRIKRLGSRSTYLAPRRPLRTTAVRCRIRGGEYTEPDQANYQTALAVWLAQAEAGDPEAQFYVGQIYEKGLGTEPDFVRAASWYRRAAERGYSAAQVSLAYLYEEGLGLDRNPLAALDWYRRAAGLSPGLVVLEQTDYDELIRLQDAIELRDSQASSLNREIEELARQLHELERQAGADQDRQATLRSLIARLEDQLRAERTVIAEQRQQIAALEAAQAAAPTSRVRAAPPRRPLEFGRYYALVIGNSEYRHLPDLEAPVTDAGSVAELLEERYGFVVELLLDATRFEIVDALNNLRESLTSDDNLLVYYAGHGERDEDRNTAYWQPVDARPDLSSQWIPSGLLADYLDLVPAKHVFVVADSVFSGLRSRSSVARLASGMTDEERYFHIRNLLQRRARLVLVSGAKGPEPEGSTFTRAFLDVLRANDQILEASQVYRSVSDRVSQAVPPGSANPELATMRWARGDVAEFFFVPK